MATNELSDHFYKNKTASLGGEDGREWYYLVVGGIGRWVPVGEKELREIRNNAHPDRGGSDEEFIRANKAYQQFLNKRIP